MKDQKIKLEQLIDYIDNRLSPEDTSYVKAMIEDDPVLQNMIVVLKGMKDENETTEWGKLKEPSHTIFERLLKDTKKRDREKNKTRGVNIFDSALLPNPEGVRPAEVDTRRMKYLFDQAQLEISTYPVSPDAYELIGQIIGIEEKGRLTIEINGDQSFHVTANEFNLFRFPRVPSGNYSLKILDKKTIIGKIDLAL